MAFDTLGYAKHLEQAGVERRQAEAHAEAMNQYLRPELATKADLAALEQRIAQRFTTQVQRFERLIPQTQWQTLGIMAALLGILFALLRFTGSG